MVVSQTKEYKRDYMREYTRKNKERLSVQRKDRRLAKIARGEPVREGEAKRNRKYYKLNQSEINSRAKAKKWNYTAEKGRMKREKYKQKYGPQVAITSARIRARKLNLLFDLTVEWYEQEFEKGCAMTGLKLDYNGAKTPWVAHVDRIIPANGYVKSNCRLVCACYNLAKKHWTDKVVLEMAKALIIKTSDA